MRKFYLNPKHKREYHDELEEIMSSTEDSWQYRSSLGLDMIDSLEMTKRPRKNSNRVHTATEKAGRGREDTVLSEELVQVLQSKKWS